MSDEIEILSPLSLRKAGLDEYWLQKKIYDNPACLGLGDLEAIAKERQQSSGGRLDLLLKEPEDDSMFEVEIMLGETDESHIIRTIEYWDNEKRKWPLRQHFAVLVAERINGRFFNVIQLLSHSIPIIAIQVSMITVNGKTGLLFTKVLDTYEEIEDGTSLEDRPYKRDDWIKTAKWCVDAADSLWQITSGVLDSSALTYTKSYIAITVDGHNYMRFFKRSQSKSLLRFRIAPDLQKEVAGVLDAKNITYVQNPKGFLMTVDREMIDQNKEVLTSITDFIKQSWEPKAQ